MASSPTFFLHFLNREVLRLYGWAGRPSQATRQHANSLTRCAFLLSTEPILIPPASLFELDFAEQFVAELAPASELHLVDYVSPTADLGDYATKKRREYRDQLSMFSRYAGPTPHVDERLLDRLTWRPRVRRSASQAITKEWLDSLVIPSGAVHSIVDTRARKRGTTRLESQLASVPRRLDGRAFIPSNVLSLISSDLTEREVTNVSLLISKAYVLSFLDEYSAAIVVDTPFGPLDCGVTAKNDQGEQRTYSYRKFRGLLSTCSLDRLLDPGLPLALLLELTHEPIYLWFRGIVLKALIGPDVSLHMSLLRFKPRGGAASFRRQPVRAAIKILYQLHECFMAFEERRRAEDKWLVGSHVRTPNELQLSLWAELVPATYGSAAMDQEQGEELRRAATIGIIVALPKEFAAVTAVFGKLATSTAPGRGAGRRYALTTIPSFDGGSHVVALALLPDMGNNTAAALATRLLEHCPGVKHLIMCGIAGGIPTPSEPKVFAHLGDVIVADEYGVVQYDFIKQEEIEIQPRHRPRPPGAELREAVQYLAAEILLGRRPWEKFIPLGEAVIGGLRPEDGLDAEAKPITYPPDDSREPGKLKVFSGPIAAANRLLKDRGVRDRLHEKYGVLAVEMESSGIADATWFMDAGYLTVRGICDYCDPAKGDVWQGFAAVAAAAYVRALVESMPSETSTATRATRR